MGTVTHLFWKAPQLSYGATVTQSANHLWQYKFVL